MKDYKFRCSETAQVSDPSIGKRMSGIQSIWATKTLLVQGLKHDHGKFGGYKSSPFGGKRNTWFRKHIGLIVFMFGLMGCYLLLDSLMVSIIRSIYVQNHSESAEFMAGRKAYSTEEKSPVKMYGRLLKLASTVVSEKESKQESITFWEERYKKGAEWKPCADRKFSLNSGKAHTTNGYILVSANGGLNQQRVAICNVVAVASLLNATLVIPRFLYSNVWKDPSQFSDIYQEEYFMDVLKNDVHIVKELPAHLESLDIEEMGSLITDSDLPKEAKPNDYFNIVLPLLKQNGIVHFLGYGNRLGFDPMPSGIQKLRCKCNFHALKFVPKIQEVGSLLLRRIRNYDRSINMIDKQLVGNFMPNEQNISRRPSKYLALHLRFEIDMVAYSMCDFGGGDRERNELETYREIHFPLLRERLKKYKPVSPKKLRKLGRCPLTPEEAALVLAALGFKHGTYIYLAGSAIYGGKSRMDPLTNLYPNLVTKEDLLTPRELAPFRNFSSQLAALDFIACAAADVFSMTDSGSQLSSLVSGFRTYYGNGIAPTLRPNKKRLATILLENGTIEWDSFEDRIIKMIEEGQRVGVRGFGRSIYRQPKCPECMCKFH